MAYACAWVLSILILLLTCLLSQQHSLFTSALVSSNAYIVYCGERLHHEPEQVQEHHHKILSEVLGSKRAAEESLLYSYKHGFSGFSARLTKSQAKLIAGYPGVVRVIRNRILSLHTTRSWDFLGVRPQVLNGIVHKSDLCADVIIGVMDTGIWPESESFKDEGMSDIPPRWRGTCEEGERFNHSNCNRKIIGARWYIKGYEEEFGSLNTSEGVEFRSPRDAAGHGTHTSSIAAGAPVRNASYMGLAQGVARGGAPSARLAVYKICWSRGGCSSADLLAAFDHAIADGVDIVSLSLGTTTPLPTYVDDTLAIGSFHAVANGITVVCSGGNAGPFPQTIINTAPWLVTVAASTIDRAFPTAIILGNNQTLLGQALYTGKNVNKFYTIVYGGDIASADSDEDSASSCSPGSLNATLARGKVVVCFQSRSQRSAAVAISTVEGVHGVGLIFAMFPTKDVTVSSSIPCVQVDVTLGTYLLTFMEGNSNPVVKFAPTRTVIGRQVSPEVAYFSSRGPSSLSPSVLKPDIAAPGVNILASWSPAASGLSKVGQASSLNFNIESGTSMACPHITGIVALLKAVHPTWTPSMIKSALVTTASIHDDYGETVAEGAPHKHADAFDYGGGHVNPNNAMDPGLVYDTEIPDYDCFLCSLGYNDSAISTITQRPTKCNAYASESCAVNLNMPSIVMPNLKNIADVTRTVTNVGPINSIYTARVKSPPGTYVSISPRKLTFSSSVMKHNFTVRFYPRRRVQGRYTFGYLFWHDFVHVVRIPLVARIVIDDFSAQT